jgi:hypothetical protein
MASLLKHAVLNEDRRRLGEIKPVDFGTVVARSLIMVVKISEEICRLMLVMWMQSAGYACCA